MKKHSGHSPVMADEVADFFYEGKTDGLMVDGTAGGGGHLFELTRRMPRSRFLALDRDPSAVSGLKERFASNPSVTVCRGSYVCIPEILQEEDMGMASGALFDLGLSSLQLDDADRGFSYRMDGPLDMRFDRSGELTAEYLVNRIDEKELADIIYNYGEEGRSRPIARAIAKARPIKTTRDLADVVTGAVRGRGVKVLSRVFQALRIAVNRELENLDRLLSELHTWTEPGARIAFITFHSLEDRRIKLLFRDDDRYSQHSPKWLVPGEEELKMNSRARPARLRMGIRTGD
ncbi:MAG: 16S rRNA (cytosine(1402)-N(4))-methyltransferase RsmH [Candidatus Aegiribacteria sp.]|nr:16S rRNA (cytosine(1402)-N(4))-methyltransferase RsmH [Candidatus Aegiribacteria sp.]MBD3295428.1 16S rRNA (cytosine(1402)-N(4))-methyltransferase RsmH [Candidatus Fermentibacteria bacterium]